MNSDRFADTVHAALAPLVEETPPPPDWDDLPSPVSDERIPARTGWLIAAAAAAAVVVVVGGAVLLLGSPTAEPGVSTTAVTTTTQPAGPIDSFDVSVAQTSEPPIPVGNPLGSGTVATDVTPEVGGRVHSAALEAASRWGVGSLDGVEIAVERGGVVYALVRYGDQTGLIGVNPDGTLALSRFSGRDPSIAMTRPVDFVGAADVFWLEVPAEAVYVKMTTAERSDSIAPQATIGNAAFFALAKPNWTQLAQLNAYAADGTVVASTSVLVDGGGCSARNEIPFPPHNPDLPAAVNETRAAMMQATVQCNYAELQRSAAGPGPHFGVDQEDLGAFLRDTDLTTFPIMEAIRSLLRTHSPIMSETEPVTYSWTDDEITITISEDGTWAAATTE